MIEDRLRYLSRLSLLGVLALFCVVRAPMLPGFTATSQTCRISGTVRDSAPPYEALAGVQMAGLPGAPETDASGYYAATVPQGWSGPIHPTKPCYTFGSVYLHNVTYDSDHHDFTGRVSIVEVVGKVSTSSDQGIAGVVMDGFSDHTETDAKGQYQGTCPTCSARIITPSKYGYSFNPRNRSYPDVDTRWSNQNYVGTPLMYSIYGVVRTSSSAGIGGVTMKGLPGDPVTGTAGNYNVGVPYGWSGTVTPSKQGYSFSPQSRTYSDVRAVQAGQDYIGVLPTYTISGAVRTPSSQGIPGVTLVGLPGSPVTDAAGNYTAAVPQGWEGSAVPSKAGFAFTPPSRTYSGVVASLSGQDYTGTATLPVLTVVSAASLLAGAPLAPASIAAGFGHDMIAVTAVAPQSPPLPTTLAGSVVKVKDSAGTERLAPLWFVSPGQINFYVPDGTAAGLADVTVESQARVVAAGTVQIEAVAPSLFSMNGDGRGVAAAVAVRARPDGSQSWQYVSAPNCVAGSCTSLPIDLGPDTDHVFLELYGTGIRGRSQFSAVGATIGGIAAPVEYAGPVADNIGLDQVNVQVPRSLAGRGEVNVVITADGKASNAVTVSIQ